MATLDRKLGLRTGPAQRQRSYCQQWACRSGPALAHTAGFRTQRLQEESSVSLGEGGLLQPNSSQTGKERC